MSLENTRTLTLNEIYKLDDAGCTYSNFKGFFRYSAVLKDKVSKKYLIKIWDHRCNELYSGYFNSLKDLERQMEHILDNWSIFV